MRPINLKIRGLNSFIEQQEISFETLTKYGLFGIFGPTGSGKSTILDGITLALYGEISRKSTNFMNTNCDSLNVSFTFQITTTERKIYRVDREFRRDKKSQGIRSKSAKIIEIGLSGEKILEENAKNVTKKCEEIIGLTAEDFTRTVVLPQGNFSEFLKLEGKERRDMLERLFNLQQYGDQLSLKLATRIKSEREHMNLLAGELHGYEDCSREILKEKEEDLAQTTKQHKEIAEEYKYTYNQFLESKKLWELQEEWKIQEKAMENLTLQKEEIEAVKQKVFFGESAWKLKPYVDNYEDTQKKNNEARSECEKLQNKLKELDETKEKRNLQYKIAKEYKEDKLPEWQMKEQRILEAIKEYKMVLPLQKEVEVLSEEIEVLEDKLGTAKNMISLQDNIMEETTKEIEGIESKITNSKISESFKQKLNEAVVIKSSFESIKTQKEYLEKECNELHLQLEQGRKTCQKEYTIFQEKKNEILEMEKTYQNLIIQCPISQESLAQEQERWLKNKEQWDKHQTHILAISKSEESIFIIQQQLKVKEPELAKLEKDLEEVVNIQKQVEHQNIAMILRGELRDKDVCPVCGSKEHHLENLSLVDSKDHKLLQEQEQEKRKKIEILRKEVITIHAKIHGEEDNKKNQEKCLLELGEVYNQEEIKQQEDNYNLHKNKLEQFQLEKNKQEMNLIKEKEVKNVLEIGYNNVATIVAQKEELEKKEQQKLIIILKEYKNLEDKLVRYQQELELEDFELANNEIIKKEQQKEKMEQQLKELRDKLLKAQDYKEKIRKEQEEYTASHIHKKTIVKAKKEIIAEKMTDILQKGGEIDSLEENRRNTVKKMNEIIQEYKVAEKNKEEIELEHNEVNRKMITLHGNIVSLGQRLENDKAALEESFSKEPIKDKCEVRKNLCSKVEMEKMNSVIDTYVTAVAKVEGALERLGVKLKGESLEKEKWNKIQQQLTEIEILRKEIAAQEVLQQQEVIMIRTKRDIKKELLRKKQIVDKKLALLGDLEKLFKGKRFVEFVATNQLKYVSIAASKKLKEITGGNYGLEIDENGKFLIRDYKNGGATRDATTLSGGETFLASLALALSLSAQIQLKGTAPLELFFLDEGFGTLDDNLLETVMDSLEKIRNDKLSIGIISHLETIKERMPIKLMVTAAKAGMGGSQVKVER